MKNKFATEDFFTECMIGQEMSVTNFEQRFCRVCKNQECHRAGWGESQWVSRISTQVDRLLTNPNFADPRDPKFRHIREHDFPDLLKEAIRVEIVDQRGDWSIPTEEDVKSSITPHGIRAVPPNELTPSSNTQEENVGQNLTQEQPPQNSGSDLKSDQNNDRENLSSQQPIPDRQINTDKKRGVGIFTNTPFPKGGLMIDGSSPVQRTTENSPSKPPSSDQAVRQPSRLSLIHI